LAKSFWLIEFTEKCKYFPEPSSKYIFKVLSEKTSLYRLYPEKKSHKYRQRTNWQPKLQRTQLTSWRYASSYIFEKALVPLAEFLVHFLRHSSVFFMN